MRILAVIILAYLLFGCAGAYIKQIPVVNSDGSKYYLLTNNMNYSESSRAYAAKEMKDYSTKLCPSGYDLANEESIPVNHVLGIHNGQYQLIWQIKCNNQL
ncbi:MAG: hypothetical protein ABI167_10270 [Nitrosospira sp.]